MRARAFALSAAVLLAAGCGGAGRAPVFDAIARALPPLAGESKSESKDEAKNESPSAPSSAPASAPTSGGGGFYLDDGPPAVSSADLAAIPDAAPRAEPILAARNRPYSALGQNFSPMTELRPYRRRGLASWYGRRYHGRKTSLGETYDMFKMTAAHPTLPLPSYARVTRVDAPDKTVVVRVNDRGPFLRGRIIDLSYAAAAKLGIVKNGVGAVEVELLLPPFADDSPRPSAARRRRCAADAPPLRSVDSARPPLCPRCSWRLYPIRIRRAVCAIWRRNTCSRAQSTIRFASMSKTDFLRFASSAIPTARRRSATGRCFAKSIPRCAVL